MKESELISPLVSVLMCTYKYTLFLEKSIESIQAQTYQNIELVLVLNCISDSDFLKINQFCSRYSFIKIFKTNICQLSYNLNFGLDCCKSEYVIRMDDDDICYPNRIKTLLELMLMNNADVVGSASDYINEKGDIIGFSKHICFTNAEIRRSLPYKNPIIHPSTLIKKSCILSAGGYLGGFLSEDYDLWIRLSRNQSIVFLNTKEKLLKYRIHSKQSKGNCNAYSEVSGYMFREFLYRINFRFLIGGFLYFLKALYCRVFL